jgi:hypothetical protein
MKMMEDEDEEPYSTGHITVDAGPSLSRDHVDATD